MDSLLKTAVVLKWPVPMRVWFLAFLDGSALSAVLLQHGAGMSPMLEHLASEEP